MADIKRIIVQGLMCQCKNTCEEGTRTPYPLDSSTDDNVTGAFCLNCPMSSWEDENVFPCTPKNLAALQK